MLGPPMSMFSIASAIGHTGLGHGGGKWIEVDHDQIDGLDPGLLELGAVFRLVPPGQDAAMDAGMEGLDPAVQDLRESRHFRDVRHR